MGLFGTIQAQSTQLAFTQAAVVGSTGTATTTIGDMNVVADTQGNTYAAGSFIGTVNFGSYALTSADYNVFVTKRNAAGTYLWAVQGGGSGEQRCKALAVDAGGNVYVTGHFTSVPTATFGTTVLTNASVGAEQADVFVAKLNGSSLAWEWANRAGGGTRINGNDYGTVVAVDGLGNVYVAGDFDSSVAFFGTSMQVPNPYPGSSNAFLGKLTPAGTWVWAKGQQYIGQAASGLAIDANQNVYLTGIYGGRATFGVFTLTSWLLEAFVAKIDGTGTWQWATGTGSTPSRNYNRSVTISAVTSDSGRGLYVAGGFGGGSSVPDTVIIGSTVLTNTGALETGPSGGLRRTFNGYVARLDAATGAWRWGVQTTGAGTENFGRPLVDGAGHVYASGTFSDPVQSNPNNRGNTFGTTTLYSAGSTDLVVAQLDTAGRWLWARQAGGPSAETATLCSVDAQGRGMLLGTFAGATVQIGPSTLAQFSAAQSWWTYFVATLGANGPLASRSAATAPGFEVFPNPASTVINIVELPAGQAVQVLDVVGRTVLTGQAPERGSLQLSLPVSLPAGLYIVRAGAQAQRLVVE